MTKKILDILSSEEQKWIEQAADIVAVIYVPHFLKSINVEKAAKIYL